MTKTQIVTVQTQKTVTAATLPMDKQMLKQMELNALMNRRITPEQCKHLSSDEITLALLQVL